MVAAVECKAKRMPDADLWQLERFGVRPTTLEETAHFKIYREFALYPLDTVERQ